MILEARTQVWVDGSQSYVDSDEAQEGTRANIGLYGEYVVQPSWRVGAGLQAANQNNKTVENGIKKIRAMAFKPTLYWVAKTWLGGIPPL